MHWPAAALVLLSLLPATFAAAGSPRQARQDAASVPHAQQLPLPSDGELGTAHLSNGSAVALQGRVRDLSFLHADSNGSTVVNITLQGLPHNYSDATPACSFLPLGFVRSLEDASMQSAGTSDFTQLSSLSVKYLAQAFNQNQTVATLDIVPTAECENVDDDCPDGLYNFTVACRVSSGGQPVVPVVIAQADDGDEQSGPAFIVSVGEASVFLRRVTFSSLGPTTGPASGNTSVVVKGKGLYRGVECVFLNGTAQPMQWLRVNASIQSDQQAVCITPEWDLPSVADRLVVTVQLVWPDGCALPAGNFTYFQTPLIKEAGPSVVPRYGSPPLAALFFQGFASLLVDSTVRLQPLLRLTAPGINGVQRVLPGNWTADGGGLTARLQEADGQQLPQGPYLLEASLNGRDFSGGRNGRDWVLQVSGPLISMMAPFKALSGNESNVTLAAQLSTRPLVPVTASVKLQQRTASGVGQAQLPGDMLQTGQLYWQAGSNATQPIVLKLPQGNPLKDRALIVTLESVSGADVDFEQSSTVVTAARPRDVQTTFEAQFNQVVYPNASARIPVNVTAGRIAVPTAVRYTIEPQTPLEQPFLPTFNGTTAGVLRWDPANGTDSSIPVPIQWSQVPMEAVYRLGVSLYPSATARVRDHRRQPALHIFGVHTGTCPPGTYLKSAPGSGSANASAAAAAGSAAGSGGNASAADAAAAPAAESHLEGLHLIAPDGSEVELSTRFEPANTVYGASVSMDVTNATLCIDPFRSGATVTVFDSRHDLLLPAGDPAADGPAAATTFSATTVGGRRRRHLALLGVRPAACAAQQVAYSLPFELGQNDFDMYITSNRSGTVEPLATYSDAQRAMRAQGNSTVRYSLAVVRLADAAHVQLASLNATTADGQLLAVCGGDAAAAGSSNDTSADAGSSDGRRRRWAAASAPGQLIACQPEKVIPLNVSADTEWLRLNPGLRFPDVQGIRVEVNGQVLSQGGNLGADRITDTTSQVQIRDNPGFLPSAVIVGLQPGVPLQVPIVIIAEDGVTSLRYYVGITRDAAAALAPETDEAGSSDGLDEVPPAAAPGPLAGMLSDLSRASLQHLRVDAPNATYDDDGSGSDSSGNSRGSSAARDVSDSAAAAAGDPQGAAAAAADLALPLPDGWPTPPARQEQCGPCIGGWASVTSNASYCTMCSPGTYAASAYSANCSACPAGTYASSWGSTHCRHCVLGTYGASEGAQLCVMCPTNWTNLADGSTRCRTRVGPGTDLSTRYAVIVSFGVLLNGTALSEIAGRVGVNASAEAILDTLVRADTASAFNISLGDVHVTGVDQIARRVLYVNVSASLPVEIPPGASDEDIKTALNIRSISADEPIQLLVQDPDKFFGRTTKALDVNAEGDGHGASRTLSSPSSGNRLALEWPAILGIILGCLVVIALAAAVFARRRTRRLYQAVAGRMPRLRLPGLPAFRLPGLVERAGSGTSSIGASTSPAAAVATQSPTTARPRPRADRMLGREVYSDSAAGSAA